jgi:hypothetical protein
MGPGLLVAVWRKRVPTDLQDHRSTNCPRDPKHHFSTSIWPGPNVRSLCAQGSTARNTIEPIDRGPWSNGTSSTKGTMHVTNLHCLNTTHSSELHEPVCSLQSLKAYTVEKQEKMYMCPLYFKNKTTGQS